VITTPNTHVHRLFLLAGALFTTVGLPCAQQAPAQSAQSPADKQINNLFDRDVILLKAPKASAGAFNPLTSTYNPLVGRGYFLTVSSEF
jgi:hypothetical protein